MTVWQLMSDELQLSNGNDKLMKLIGLQTASRPDVRSVSRSTWEALNRPITSCERWSSEVPVRVNSQGHNIGYTERCHDIFLLHLRQKHLSLKEICDYFVTGSLPLTFRQCKMPQNKNGMW